MKFKKIKQTGMTLIELMIVLGIAMTLSMVFFLAVPKLQVKTRTSTEYQHVTMISSGIRSQYFSTHNFSTINNTVVLNSKIIPESMQVQGTNIVNVWNGSVVVQPDPGSNLFYNLIYNGVPRTECTTLSVAVGGIFLKLVINGTTIFDHTAVGNTIDIDPSALTAACIEGVNTLVFVGN